MILSNEDRMGWEKKYISSTGTVLNSTHIKKSVFIVLFCFGVLTHDCGGPVADPARYRLRYGCMNATALLISLTMIRRI